MSKRHPSTTPPEQAESVWLGRWFTGARREGLLSALPSEAWQTLSAILSFTTRDGRRVFSVDQLALALRESRETAEARLNALAEITWNEQALLTLERRGEEIVGATVAL